jgi:hypothetical protein
MNYRRRNFVAILLALALSVFVVSEALAEGGKQQKRKSVIFTASGLVREIETSNPASMVLEVDKTNRVAKRCNGVFAVSENVRVKTEGSEPGEFDLGLDDVKEDYYVRVLGMTSPDGDCVVTRIVVWIDE